jgi:hypothetical protein
MPVDRRDIRSLDIEQQRHAAVRSEDGQTHNNDQRGRCNDDLPASDFCRMRSTPPSSCPAPHFELAPLTAVKSSTFIATTGGMINDLIARRESPSLVILIWRCRRSMGLRLWKRSAK